MSGQKWEIKEVGIAVFKGLLGAVPYAGTALNECLFETRGRIKQKRINTFIEELSKYMAIIDGNHINFEFIKSEEFGDIFESILKRVAYNRSTEKLHRFKKILANQMVSPKETVFTETFLDLVQRLEEQQINILMHYRGLHSGEIDRQKQLPDRNVIDANIEEDVKVPNYMRPEYFGLDEVQYQFFIQDLISKALLIDDSMNRLGTRPFEVLEISQFGLQFLEFLET